MSGNRQEMRFVSHQGTRVYAPENTVLGYEKAAQMGYYALNFAGVRASADGVMYIMHDKTVDRTTDGTGPIAELTSAEIDRLTVDRQEPYAEYDIRDIPPDKRRVPTLEQCIRVCLTYGCVPMIRMGISVPGNERVFDKLHRIIRGYGIADRMMLSGSTETMLALDSAYPNAPKIVFLPDLTAAEAVAHFDAFPFRRKETVYAMLRSRNLTREGLQTLRDGGYGTYSSNPGDMQNPESTRQICRELAANGCEYVNGERYASLAD